MLVEALRALSTKLLKLIAHVGARLVLAPAIVAQVVDPQEGLTVAGKSILTLPALDKPSSMVMLNT